MINVLNSNQSKRLDALSINQNFDLDNLIDNAGKSLSIHILENVSNPFNKTFLCISGIGNNGLDSIVCNYYLNKNNVKSDVLIINPDMINSKYLKKYASKFKYLNIDNVDDLSKYDWIVDGMFGTGFNRDMEGLYLKLSKKLENHKNILSIDIPSGVYTDTGNSANSHIKARETITFTYPKICHFFGDGYANSGELHIYPIGHLDNYNNDVNIELIERLDICSLIKSENKNSNKYSNKKVISVCGSKRYTGALLLSNSSAMRSGVKILRKIIPSSLKEISFQHFESIDILIEDENKGYLGLEDYDKIIKELLWSDTLLIGPGLDESKDSVLLMSKILKSYAGLCIIDASAFLPIINGELEINDIPEYSILTPHYGEFAKILNISIDELHNNTIEILDEFSKKLSNRILILKGPNTVIMTGSGNKYIIDNGNSLLSTAGTGDVLSGIITGYLSNGYSLLDSSILGAYLHSECSSYLSKRGYDTIIASDLLPLIPKVQYDLRNSVDET